MDYTLELTKENIESWKFALSMAVVKKTKVHDYQSTISDKEWLERHEGKSVEEAMDDELSNWYD